MPDHRSRRHRAREDEGLTMGDRFGAAFVGAVIGGVVGVAIAWGLGVYSSRLGASTLHINFGRWVLGTAGVFALIGLFFGPVVGTLLGEVIGALFAFESDTHRGSLPLPGWLVVVLALLAAVGVYWWQHH